MWYNSLAAMALRQKEGLLMSGEVNPSAQQALAKAGLPGSRSEEPSTPEVVNQVPMKEWLPASELCGGTSCSSELEEIDYLEL